MNKQEVMDLLVTEGITLTDVIDAVIEQNRIIGVGLISLGDQVRNYIVHWEKEVTGGN